jgi:hypothetical protein
MREVAQVLGCVVLRLTRIRRVERRVACSVTNQGKGEIRIRRRTTENFSANRKRTRTRAAHPFLFILLRPQQQIADCQEMRQYPGQFLMSLHHDPLMQILEPHQHRLKHRQTALDMRPIRRARLRQERKALLVPLEPALERTDLGQETLDDGESERWSGMEEGEDVETRTLEGGGKHEGREDRGGEEREGEDGVWVGGGRGKRGEGVDPLELGGLVRKREDVEGIR